MNMRKKRLNYYWPNGRRRYRKYGSFTVTYTETINQIGLGVHAFFKKWIESTSLTGNEPVDHTLPLCAS